MAPDAARILLHHPEEVPARQPGPEVRHLDVDPERSKPRGQHGERLRQAVGVDHDPVGLASRSPAHQCDRLGHRRAFVQQRCVRRVQPGQVRHHGLEVQQRLQPTLADLGLVRRVGRVPGRALEHVAPDHARRDRPVVAQADHGFGDHVAPGQAAQLLEHGLLGSRRRQIECLQAAHTPGHGGVDQRVERVVTEHLEHALLLLGRGTDMASDEVLEGLERGGALGLCRRMACAHGGLLVGSAFTRSSPVVLPALSWYLRVSPPDSDFHLRCGHPEGCPLSRVASPERYVGLRVSRGELLLRRPLDWCCGDSGAPVQSAYSVVDPILPPGPPSTDTPGSGTVARPKRHRLRGGTGRDDFNRRSRRVVLRASPRSPGGDVGSASVPTCGCCPHSRAERQPRTLVQAAGPETPVLERYCRVYPDNAYSEHSVPASGDKIESPDGSQCQVLDLPGLPSQTVGTDQWLTRATPAWISSSRRPRRSTWLLALVRAQKMQGSSLHSRTGSVATWQ